MIFNLVVRKNYGITGILFEYNNITVQKKTNFNVEFHTLTPVYQHLLRKWDQMNTNYRILT